MGLCSRAVFPTQINPLCLLFLHKSSRPHSVSDKTGLLLLSFGILAISLMTILGGVGEEGCCNRTCLKCLGWEAVIRTRNVTYRSPLPSYAHFMLSLVERQTDRDGRMDRTRDKNKNKSTKTTKQTGTHSSIPRALSLSLSLSHTHTHTHTHRAVQTDKSV